MYVLYCMYVGHGGQPYAVIIAHTHTHLHTHIHTHIHTQKQETAVSSPL